MLSLFSCSGQRKGLGTRLVFSIITVHDMLCLNICTNSFVCRSGLIRKSKANRVNNCWSGSGFLCVIVYCYLCTWDSCNMYIITTHRQVSQPLPLYKHVTHHIYTIVTCMDYTLMQVPNTLVYWLAALT